jgi:hypothetical protein
MINYHELHDLSCQYWEAIARQDYEWSDFIDSCLEREGVERLPREDCEEPILDLSPLEVN